MRQFGTRHLPWLVVTLILLLSLWLRWRYIWVTPMEFDEGHWLMFGALVNAGFPAYSVTFVGIPPLALLTIQLGEALFGYVSLALRYPMMLYSLVGIAAIFWTFTTWGDTVGILAGLFAALFLSADADALRGSGTIMAEVPAVSLALLSLALAWQYYHSRSADRRGWLLLSGVAFSLSLALKIFVVFMPVVVALLIFFSVSPNSRNKRLLAARRLVVLGGVWLFGALIPVIIFLLLYDPWAMYKQVYIFRLVVRDAYLATGLDGVSIGGNISRIGEMMFRRGPLVLGAIIGFIVNWKRRRVDVIVWLAWLCLAIILMTSHAPLRGRYSVLLLPPLAALSGMAVASVAVWSFQRLAQKWSVRWAAVAVSMFVGGLFIASLIGSFRLALAAPAPDTFAEDMRLERLDAITYARTSTTPDDCLITDDQRFAFRADRLVPPGLSETSKALLIAEWLTVDDIVREIEAHNCAAVVYALGRFDDYLPDLRERLRNLYYVEIRLTNNTIIYNVKKEVVRTPLISLDVQFGPAIFLEGIDILPKAAQPGQEIYLVTYWRALQPPEQAYKIYLQLYNNRNQVVANFDHFPFSAPNNTSGRIYQVLPSIDTRHYTAEDIAIYPKKGMLPTNVWPPGKTLREVYTMQLPADLPAGDYTLAIGLYDPDTLHRLSVQTGAGIDDEVLAAQIKILEAQ